MPIILNAPNFQEEWRFEKGGYRFFVGKEYDRNKDKDSECLHKPPGSKNKITF